MCERNQGVVTLIKNEDLYPNRAQTVHPVCTAEVTSIQLSSVDECRLRLSKPK